MKKLHKLLVLSLLFISASLVRAQVTATSGTITDSDGTLWTGAQVTVQFSPNPNYPNIASYNIAGTSLTSPTYIGYLTQIVTTNNSGAFTVNLLDNVQITPAGSRWYFVVKSNTSAQATAYVPVLVSGSSTNLSSFLSANAVPPRFPAYAGTAYGYADLEVTPIPNPGGFYYNTSVALLGQRIWSGTAWTTGGGGGGGITNNALTMNNGGAGAASGSTFNGSTPITISYNTIGAAPLNSPGFSGVPTAPTAAANTSTTQLATTAFVLGQVGTATPLIDGTAAVGSSFLYARQDHVHPTDTTRAPLASPTFTGTLTTPALTLSGTTGLVQCLQAGSTGIVTGTGSNCGAGGGGGTTTNALTINNAGSGVASGGTFNGSAAITISYNSIGALPVASPTFTGTLTGPTIVTNGSGSGTLTLSGSTSGTVTQTVPAVAGTSTIAWGNVSGTPAVTASTPLALNTTTGNLTLGNIPVTLLNSGTGASSSTFWRGDGTWAAAGGGSLPTTTNCQTYYSAATTGAATSAICVGSAGTSGSIGINGVLSQIYTAPASATTINGAITNVATTLTLTSATGWPTSCPANTCFFLLGGNQGGTQEIASYTTLSGTAMSGITRGQLGPTAAAQGNSTPITFLSYVQAASLTSYPDEICLAGQQECIFGPNNNLLNRLVGSQTNSFQNIYASSYNFANGGPNFGATFSNTGYVFNDNGSNPLVYVDSTGSIAQKTSTIGSITSATTTIAPVNQYVILSGTGPISALATITVPSAGSCTQSAFTCSVIIIDHPGLTTTTGGNIGNIISVAAHVPVTFWFVQGTSKWDVN